MKPTAEERLQEEGMGDLGHLPAVVYGRLVNIIEQAYADGMEAAAKVAEVYLHNVPQEGGDDLDRIGRYSNGTVIRIAAAIRARMEEK